MILELLADGIGYLADTFQKKIDEYCGVPTNGAEQIMPGFNKY